MVAARVLQVSSGFTMSMCYLFQPIDRTNKSRPMTIRRDRSGQRELPTANDDDDDADDAEQTDLEKRIENQQNMTSFVCVRM